MAIVAPSKQRLNREKFKELVLYIAQKSEADPKFGVTKLNKLLYYCDFNAYVDLGKAITGADYQKIEFGPAPRAIQPLRQEMIEAGDLYIREASYGYRQQRPIALRVARLAKFTGDEIALVDSIIDNFWEMDASQISAASHRDVGWMLAKEGETIPYETAFVVSVERV